MAGRIPGNNLMLSQHLFIASGLQVQFGEQTEHVCQIGNLFSEIRLCTRKFKLTFSTTCNLVSGYIFGQLCT